MKRSTRHRRRERGGNKAKKRTNGDQLDRNEQPQPPAEEAAAQRGQPPTRKATSTRRTPQTRRPTQVTDPDDGTIVTREELVGEVKGYVVAELPKYLVHCQKQISRWRYRGNNAQAEYYVFCEDVVKTVIKRRSNDVLAPAIAAAAKAMNVRRRRKIIQGKAAAEAASIAKERGHRHHQKLKRIRAAAIAAAAEARRRHCRADQLRALARAAASAASSRDQRRLQVWAIGLTAASGARQ